MTGLHKIAIKLLTIALILAPFASVFGEVPGP